MHIIDLRTYDRSNTRYVDGNHCISSVSRSALSFHHCIRGATYCVKLVYITSNSTVRVHTLTTPTYLYHISCAYTSLKHFCIVVCIRTSWSYSTPEWRVVRAVNAVALLLPYLLPYVVCYLSFVKATAFSCAKVLCSNVYTLFRFRVHSSMNCCALYICTFALNIRKHTYCMYVCM
jgi:hypothetical protein